jgi:hypothetical protein
MMQRMMLTARDSSLAAGARRIDARSAVSIYGTSRGQC